MTAIVAKENLEAREKIKNLQSSMIDGLASGIITPVQEELSHFFAPGMYGRQLIIRAGTTVVGKLHRHSHLNVISRGRIRVFTEFGYDILDATDAPVVFASEVGTKRAVYAETDTYWMTFHLVKSEDLAEIEADVIAEDYDALLKLPYTEIKGAIQ